MADGTPLDFPLSIHLDDLTARHFDVIIVGSGYGGSIAASRLAAAGKSVCVLERGKEIIPSEYPTDLTSARAQFTVFTERDGALDADANGMMQLRVNSEVHVILGNGLGGGSLVNAGVSIEPDMRVFDTGWPAAYQPCDSEDGPRTNALTPYFKQVKTNLGATTLPDHIQLNKLTALEQSAKAMEQDFQRAEINVTFADGPNAFGFQQKACNLCGDCCSGCNYSAKNTLLMNYLPHAQSHGATIVTEAELHTIAPKGTGWTANVLDRTKPMEGQETQDLTADMVILAAGALGSTEILYRSAAASQDLTLSKALGTRFSTNGDALAFGMGANLPGSSGNPDAPKALYSIGAGTHHPDEGPAYRPGPCITGVVRVDMGDEQVLEHGMLIEDGTAPGPFATIYPPLLFLEDVLCADVSAYPDMQTRLGALKTLGTGLQSGIDTAALSYSGAMTQMQSYLVMSHDQTGGTLAYSDTTEHVSVHWPGAGAAPVYTRDNDLLRQASEAIWANFVPNPIWQEGFGRNLVSVHPLGGCPMADNDTDGVTDAECRVYKGDGKNSVYDTLFVCDGSVVPRCLGVNPLLTISAITERAMDQLLKPAAVAAPAKPATSAAPKAPPQPAPAALPQAAPARAGLAIDWDTIHKDLLETWLAIAVVAKAADHKTKHTTLQRLAVGAAITKLAAEILPDVDVSVFVADLLADADLQNDIGPAFDALAADLSSLTDAISNNETEELLPFLDALFTAVGDISPGFGFDEAMQGHVAPAWDDQGYDVSDPYDIAEATGKATGQAMEARFSIKAAHTLGRDPKDPKYPNGKIKAQIKGAALSGTVSVTDADGKKTDYTVANGTFDLLLPDPHRVETWLMTYRCDLLDGSGGAAVWHMEGIKTLRRRTGSFWWTDVTTLFVDLTPAQTSGGSGPMQGIIRLDLQDLAKQVSTISGGYYPPLTVDALKTAAIDAAKAGTFHDAITKGPLLTQAFLLLLATAPDREADDSWPVRLGGALEMFFAAGIAGIFGTLIFRAYGGFPAYMEDFPSQSDGTFKALPEPDKDSILGSLCENVSLPDKQAPQVRLYHFAPPDASKPAKGPIVLAPGMSTTALSFALQTIDTSLVERLLAENYDVWLFDSRLSPRVTPVNTGYTLDDVAAEDWPMAVDYVLKNSKVTHTGTPTVQILGHCVGALTAQMAVLGGHVKTENVRQMVIMQFTVHPSPNAFNVAKSEFGLARDFTSGFPAVLVDLLHSEIGDTPDWDEIKDVLEHGIPSINPVSPAPGPGGQEKLIDEIHNTVDWSAPFGIDHLCYSPTCHRIYGLYGPVIAHANLNEHTHDAMREMFGEIATKPFVQLGLIMERGHAVSASGEEIYLPYVKRLNVPFHVISGSVNQILQPESGFRTIQWLKRSLPDMAHQFTRTLVKGYAHNDCFIGKNSNRDVFDGIMNVLAPYGQGRKT